MRVRRWSTFDTQTAAAELPALDRYSLRLVASRKLYDQGVLTQHAPSLAGLAPGTVLRVNPYDFDRLGVAAGARGAPARRPGPIVRVDISSDPGRAPRQRRGLLQPARPRRRPS